MSGFEFPALKPGETDRACEKCGGSFIPSTRTQRFCPDCRAAASAPRREKPSDGRKQAVEEARKKMERNTFGLNDAMFRELERIEACETLEEIEAEGMRADKVCSLASNIIANGRLMV